MNLDKYDRPPAVIPKIMLYSQNEAPRRSDSFTGRIEKANAQRRPDMELRDQHRMPTRTHLSPWDLSGLSMGFGIYRPRRPSYTFATQAQRQRSESYRYAVRKSASDIDEAPDFIEGIIQRKNRKESYIRATKRDEYGDLDLELNFVEECPSPQEQQSPPGASLLPNENSTRVPEMVINYVDKKESNNQNNHVDINAQTSRLNGAQIQIKADVGPVAMTENHIKELKAAVAAKKRMSPKKGSPASNHSPSSRRIRKKSMALAFKDYDDDYQEDSVFTSDQVDSARKDDVTTPSSCDNTSFPGPFSRIRFRKNLTFLCFSFISIFSAFRAIQNLQSSLNAKDNLGIIAMTCVHGTMFFTCLWAPLIINKVTAKWTLVIGMFSFIIWIAANFFPSFYTLIPFGIIAGVGQGILWTAEASYILKLAFDSSRVTRDGLEQEMFRFHGIFLACFQTTHIWGNLISSVVLSSAKANHQNELDRQTSGSNFSMQEPSYFVEPSCGVLFPCNKPQASDITKDVPSSLWKLMSAYVALGFIAFFLVMLCLDKIGARVDPEKSAYAIVVDHVSMMLSHKTFRLLIPLLIFSGLQQAFVFSDFNQAFVTCTIGEEYIGYSMIILGLANVISAFLVALFANLVPREIVFAIGGITHMVLMIFLLIWITSKSLTIFFLLSACWGLCDAVWQTQCNTLICITCPENTDVAFANYRMLQSMGLTLGFLSGTFLCVAFKLYILMILLVVAIMSYVLAEYRVRQVDVDTFEGQVEVN